MKPTTNDMMLISKVCPFITPDRIPLRFRLGNREIRGIPRDFSPCVTKTVGEPHQTITTIEGTSPQGLTITAVYTSYDDYPVGEWVCSIENRGDENSPIVSEWSILTDTVFEGVSPVIRHGNGDPWHPSAYSEIRTVLTQPLHLYPHVDKAIYGETPYQGGGTPCCGASPYMRLLFEGHGFNLAIGWPGQWEAFFTPVSCGAAVTVKQQRVRMSIAPGERMRSPQVIMMAYEGDEIYGINLWRRFCFDHIIPHAGGHALSPMLIQTTDEPGGIENTCSTEERMLAMIEGCREKEILPDVWWIDAGWYPCPAGNWGPTGTWHADKERFPRGLRPISDRCAQYGCKLLVWFEPERVCPGTELALQHPDWLLYQKGESRDNFSAAMPDLGNTSVCDGLAAIITHTLQKDGISIYRQDFNFDPLPVWTANEAADRIGAVENRYCQGYLRFWDILLQLNPGLLIDSCCGGGRRNEPEAMRRAVPLHYTDVGNDPVLMQHQHAVMFSWIPYFGSAPTTQPEPGETWGRYEYHCSMTTCFKIRTPLHGTQEDIEMLQDMIRIWRRAAPHMISGDFVLLADSNGSPQRYFSMQFDVPGQEAGFFQVIRNQQCAEQVFTVFPLLRPDVTYRLENSESGEHLVLLGADLLQGFAVRIPKKSGVIWFYERCEQ